VKAGYATNVFCTKGQLGAACGNKTIFTARA